MAIISSGKAGKALVLRLPIYMFMISRTMETHSCTLAVVEEIYQAINAQLNSHVTKHWPGWTSMKMNGNS